jgi:hypothetical protein
MPFGLASSLVDVVMALALPRIRLTLPVPDTSRRARILPHTRKDARHARVIGTSPEPHKHPAALIRQRLQPWACRRPGPPSQRSRADTAPA